MSGSRLQREDELRFYERLQKALLSKLRWAFAVAALLFTAFAYIDHRVEPGVLARTGAIRAGVVLAYLTLHFLTRRPRALQAVNVLMLVGVALGGAALTIIYVDMVDGELLATGSLLLMVVVMSALTMTFRTALVGYGVLIAILNVLGLILGASAFFLGIVNVFVISGAIPGVMLAWISERQARHAYVLELELERMAKHDSLTGARNRGSLLELSRLELIRAQRYARPVSLLLLDIDRFKSINDTYGHPVGDAVIRALADICRKVLREGDVLGRVGGEEFAILLPETQEPAAQQVAERLRVAISEFRVRAGDHDIAFTVSIGAALWIPGEPLERLFSRADEALYLAKNSGRNRVCAAKAA